MKILRTTLLLIMSAFLFIQPVGAIVSSTHASATTVEQQSSALKKEFKAEKKVAKLQKMLAKAGIDLQDPVKKWLWFALGLAIISVVLSVINVGSLAYIAWVAAGICVIIWLLKYADVL